MLTWLRKCYARMVLITLFAIHLVRRSFIFWRKGQGLKKFLDNYASDAVTSVSPIERKNLASFQRCLACSFCSFSCEAILEGRGPVGFEPKYLILSAGRSAHESEVFLEDWLPCLECDACTVVCPNDVPVHAAATQIIDRRNRLAFRS